MRKLLNPVLRGFNPDPSILRVGRDYYLATSTFEWFPGVPIYHSRDLENWRLIGHALTRKSQLDLVGVPDSAGIWAPAISRYDDVYYLVYTIVRNRSGAFKDVHNYIVTATSPDGPWSEPVYLNSSGFDPSLFHDDDGRHWLVNMQWDHRPAHPRFGGIVLQEYSLQQQRLVGPIVNICRKDPLIEGPNIYKVNGFYYLMLAEGGTDWNHGISMARARNITGPYELDPQPLVLTSRKSPGAALQKAGHGELVQTPAGRWYLAHLCSRALYPARRCPLGRETAIQAVTWSADGWLRLESGGTDPELQVALPDELEPHQWEIQPDRDDFNSPSLGPAWQSPRDVADPTWASTIERPGFLRLRGRESMHSLFRQSLLAQRVQSFHAEAETVLEFQPEHFTQSAGLIVYYDTRHHFYLRVTHEEKLGIVIGVVQTDAGVYQEFTDSQLVISHWPRVYLKAAMHDECLQFYASADARQWHVFPVLCDFTKLSADYAGGFTGAFAGLCVQDLRGTHIEADFDYFQLRNV
jgi:xylan 1,4-beta-xylosidase